MAKRSKDDKKRSKRQKAAKERRLHNKEIAEAYFEIGDGFPLDMHQEIKRCINKYSLTNRGWKELYNKDGDVWSKEFNEMICLSLDQNAFDKYFPRITVHWSLNSKKCLLRPRKLNRVLSLDYICYILPLKLPLCAGHKIIFSKHSLERLVERFFDQYNMNFKPSARAFYFQVILRELEDSDFEITYLDDIPHLHCFGSTGKTVSLNGISNARFGQGHFPLIIKDKYAVAKTFLYDKWLGSTVTN